MAENLLYMLRAVGNGGGQKCEYLNKAADEIERLLAVLVRIVNWEMPESGRTWDDGTPMSYGAAFGSNGERDFIRRVAENAFLGKDKILEPLDSQEAALKLANLLSVHSNDADRGDALVENRSKVMGILARVQI